MELLDLVVKPTWRGFLVDLIVKNKLDPWDIDLVEVADRYLEEIRKMRALDLRIPANVILASALLLRFKAEAIAFETEAEADAKQIEMIEENIPELVFRANRPRRRRVTLEELINAVDEVMKQGKRLTTRVAIPRVLNIEISKQELHEKIREVYEKAISLKDEESILLFSALLTDKTPENITYYLIPVLHLVQETKMNAWQDEFFGEIFLKVCEEREMEKEMQIKAR
ncbi:segregation/condensation protein A [Candidatus Micrarchaeota archaeon]|nr:segregation/condensation protein A [Candidatus Micrarchaeota archaeon]